MSRVDLVVPDLGNTSDVSVVDILIKVGERIEVDTPLVTLETDKASLDVPATAAGTVAEVLVKRGDKVSKGVVIARLEAGTAQPAGAGAAATPAPAAVNTAAPAETPGKPAPPVAAAGNGASPSARPESAGDTVRMPIPDLSQKNRVEGDFNRAT